MKVVITGAAGFLGQKLVARIAADGALPVPGGGTEAVDELVLFDVVAPDTPPGASMSVRAHTGDIGSADDLAPVFEGGADVVYHLAAVVSAAAEEDFELGMRVNFEGTRAVLEACRHRCPRAPRLVFTSSVAVFGGELPEVIRDDSALTPQSSYGAQKAMGELLVNDYSRRGFVDGRAVRLPTIVIRPGRPNKAASTFASSIIREPLQGEEAILPVPESTPLFVLSPRRVVDALCHAAGVPAAAFGGSRSVMLPGITVTVTEMIDALRETGGEAAVSRIRAEPDAGIQAIVGSWPARFDTAKAERLGFRADADMASIMQAFIEDDLLPEARERLGR